MKKTLVSFTISFACLIGFCTLVNADVVQSWSITKDVNAWKMATLLQTQAPPITGANAEIKKTVLTNYLEGYSTVANPDKTLSRGGNLNYGNVKLADGKLTSSDAYTGNWLRYGTTNEYYTSNTLYSPGYYAFQTTFSLSPEISDLAGLYMNIDIDFWSDDVLEGIFLNGQDITKYSSLNGQSGIGYYGNEAWVKTLELSGSVNLESLIAQGLFLTDDVNTFEFIVRNGAANLYSGNSPFYFGAQGGINIGDQQFTHSFNPTPEPATLLICLTCGGLALAIRRRKNKKTE
jgi:hypothetical protein